MDISFDYLKTTGSMLESAYFYEMAHGACRYDSSIVVATVEDYVSIQSNQPEQLIVALQKQPVAVAVSGYTTPYQQYTGGVITSTDCGTEVDHGCLAVGYGVTARAA